MASATRFQSAESSRSRTDAVVNRCAATVFPATQPKGAWQEDQFGGTLGGPIRQNRLFYFASYEGTRMHRDVPNTISVPTLEVRRGDFSKTGATIYDPRTGAANGSGRSAFPGAVIPQERISEVAKKLNQHWPVPNLTNADGSVPDFNNYFVQPRFDFNRWTIDSKMNGTPPNGCRFSAATRSSISTRRTRPCSATSCKVRRVAEAIQGPAGETRSTFRPGPTLQPEILDDSFGARGGFAFNSGSASLRGTSGNNFQSFATLLLGLPAETGRLKLNVAPYTTRSWQYSFYVRDQWQVGPRMTLSFGTRYEYFPMVTRADRGTEKYNLETNLMEIGGLGSVPKNLGISTENLFAPRFGAVYRPDDRSVIRGGFGITNDPYSLARSMRTNHPILLNLYDEAEHSFTWVRPIEESIPEIPAPDLQNGIIPVPGNVTVITLPDEFTRGRIWSWNTAYERELRWGIVGEVAYIGTRQINQLGIQDQNYSELGGGSSSRQLFRKFGRTAATQLVAPIGNTRYNALQTQLSRRMRNGVTEASAISTDIRK